MDIVKPLLAKHTLISNQVSKQQVEIILRELQRVLDTGVEGDIVEFGCYVGTTSLFIRRLLETYCDTEHGRKVSSLTSAGRWSGQEKHMSRSPMREFHVYDSFEGLPPKTSQDASVTGEQFTAGALAASKKQFVREFQKAHLQPPIVHKAWFKDLTAADIPTKIAFAFLDGDFYASIRDSLALVCPRMAPGGTIIIDDYAREALPGAARAVHEFFPVHHIHTAHNLGIIRQ